jgi:hypothetical protein
MDGRGLKEGGRDTYRRALGQRRCAVNLVNELQVSAEKDDVLTVLRRATRLASKLDRQDIADWLRAEQHGYARGDAVPEYRRVRGRLAMNTNGYVPAGYGKLMNGIQDLPGFNFNPVIPVTEPISTVMSWIENMADGRQVSLPIDRNTEEDRFFRSHVEPMFRGQVAFLLHLNSAQITAIPERIKDKVLDWACALERAGVTGDGMTFSVREKEIARSVTFNISDSHIEQLNNMGTNLRGGR